MSTVKFGLFSYFLSQKIFIFWKLITVFWNYSTIFDLFDDCCFRRDPAGFDPDFVCEASSYLKKYDDKYNLVLAVRSEATGVINEATVVKSVENFIDVNGIVISEYIETLVTNLHDSLTSHRKDK